MNPSFFSNSEHFNCFSLSQTLSTNLVDRLEKVEHVIQVTDQMDKLRYSQDSLKFADFERKAADFDARLSHIEDGLLHCQLDSQIQRQNDQLQATDAIPALARALRSVKRVILQDDRKTELRTALTHKVDQLVEAAREVASQSRQTDADLQSLRRDLHRLRSHRQYTMVTVKKELALLASLGSVDRLSLDWDSEDLL